MRWVSEEACATRSTCWLGVLSSAGVTLICVMCSPFLLLVRYPVRLDDADEHLDVLQFIQLLALGQVQLAGSSFSRKRIRRKLASPGRVSVTISSGLGF